MIKGVLAAFNQVLDTVAEPKTAAKRISDGTASWLLVGALMCGLVVVLQIAEIPVIMDAVPGGASPAVMQQLNVWMTIGVLLTPVIFAARVVIVAYAIWVGTVLSGLDVPFRRCVSLTVCAQIVVVLHQAAILIIARLTTSGPRMAEVGANLFVQGHGFWAHLSALVNPFSFWYVALLALGLSFCAGTSLKRGALALAPYAFFFMALKIGEAYFTSMRGL